MLHYRPMKLKRRVYTTVWSVVSNICKPHCRHVVQKHHRQCDRDVIVTASKSGLQCNLQDVRVFCYIFTKRYMHNLVHSQFICNSIYGTTSGHIYDSNNAPRNKTVYSDTAVEIERNG